MDRKKRIAAGAAAAGALGLAAFCKWQNNGITVTRIDYKTPKLGTSEDGFRIVQISDFHSKRFGKDQGKIIEKVREEQPDLIVITGDLVDSRRGNIEAAMSFVRGIISFAPVCYVAGNHEIRMKEYRQICAGLKETGVTILENEGITIPCGGKGIRLIGLPDPSAISGTQGDFEEWVLDEIKRVVQRERRDGMFNVLLIHRPELFGLYSSCGVDLVFCGHAHGGQVRLPYLGGIIAPNQGFFPEYTEGVHREGKTTMIISRGIGNSLAPQRVWNRPEIISVAIRAGGDSE